MGATDRSRHVPPGEGEAFWVAGELLTLKTRREDTDGACTVLEEVSPPGAAGPPPHVHHREDETFCVLEGELEFALGDRTFRAVAGSVVHAPKGVPHSFKNAGTGPCRMLVVVSPGGLESFFEEVGESAADGSSPPPFGREEIERMLAIAPRYGIEMLPPPGA